MYHANINSMLGVISLTEEDGALTELRMRALDIITGLAPTIVNQLSGLR